MATATIYFMGSRPSSLRRGMGRASEYTPARPSQWVIDIEGPDPQKIQRGYPGKTWQQCRDIVQAAYGDIRIYLVDADAQNKVGTYF